MASHIRCFNLFIKDLAAVGKCEHSYCNGSGKSAEPENIGCYQGNDQGRKRSDNLIEKLEETRLELRPDQV